MPTRPGGETADYGSGGIPSERPRKARRAAMMVSMAGLEGVEQPRPRSSATAARRMPAVEDEQAFKALELFGNPTEEEVRLPPPPRVRGHRPPAHLVRRPPSVGALRAGRRTRRPARLRTRRERRAAHRRPGLRAAHAPSSRLDQDRGARPLARTSVPHAGRGGDGHQRPGGSLPRGQALRPLGGRGPLTPRQDTWFEMRISDR